MSSHHHYRHGSALLRLLMLAVITSISSQSNHPDILPVDLSQLIYPGSTAEESLTRTWTKTDLDHAWSVLNYEQMWPFFERLEAGLPLTVLAFGDSITKDLGGCFHRDR